MLPTSAETDARADGGRAEFGRTERRVEIMAELATAWIEDMLIHRASDPTRAYLGGPTASYHASWERVHAQHPKLPPDATLLRCEAMGCSLVRAHSCDCHVWRAHEPRAAYDECAAIPPSACAFSRRANHTHALAVAALRMDPVTDKLTIGAYQTTYGALLMPIAAQRGERFKLLEIGLGCDQSYGAGASARLWRQLFPSAQLWEADSDAACVASPHARGQLHRNAGVVMVSGCPA